MTRKTSSTIRSRADPSASPLPLSSATSSTRLPKPILRPVSDLMPKAPSQGKTIGKSSKGPFSSLTFAAGTALDDRGTKKQRKGVLGFFHKKESRESSSSSSPGYASSGFDSPSPESASSGSPTPTSPVFAKIVDHKMPKGSIGRGLWNRLTGTVRESKSSTASVKAKSAKNAPATARGLPMESAGSLSHAPPFPVKRPTKSGAPTALAYAKPARTSPQTLSSIFAPPPAPGEASRRDEKTRPTSSTGPLSRAPLGNVFLGPLSDSPRRSTSMDKAACPEMALEGLEAVFASGIESLRVRTMSRAAPRTGIPSVEDVFSGSSLAPPAQNIPRQSSLSVITKANRTLLDLVARLDESATSSPESSPVKPINSNLASLSPLTICKKAKPTKLAAINTDSAQSLLFLRRPKSRRIVPKASRPAHDCQPTVDVVMEKAGVPFSPGAAPIGFGMTVGVERVIQSSSPNEAHDAHPDDPDSDVPEDLQGIISDKEDNAPRQSSQGSSRDSWSASPTSPALGLPPPPPPDRISPRRGAPSTLEVPPLRISSWHSRSQKSSDDTSAVASPNERDSSTFDFTGEIQQLNENARASFFETLHPSQTTEVPLEPVFPSMREQALAAGETVLEYKASKSSSSSSSGTTTPLGALNRDFKFGSRLPSRTLPSPPEGEARKSFEAPIFRVSAPTPLPPDSPCLDAAVNTPTGAALARVSSAEALEAADVLPDESTEDSYRFSFISESTTSRRRHRRTGQGDGSVMSFASISSFGQVIHAGSRHPYSIDCSFSTADESLSPEICRSSTDSARIRKESEISILTQSSLGAIIQRENRLSANFEFSSFRNGVTYRHGHSDSIDSVASSFSFHEPTSDRRRHHRSSSIASLDEVGGVPPVPGPPISLFNQSRPNWKAARHAHNNSTDSAISAQSSMSKLPRATGRADWMRHRRQQSSADSSSSLTFGGGRPGLGDKFFSTDQAVPLFPISASPNGSPNGPHGEDSFRSDSFQLESVLRQVEAHVADAPCTVSDTDDSLSVDECRTSIDSGFSSYRFVHEHTSSLDDSAESVFGAGDESFLRPFVPSGPRPLSGHSQLSSEGEIDLENDTFAFKHSDKKKADDLQLQLPIMDKTRGKERPLSALSSNASDIDFNDTFAFKAEEEQIGNSARYTLPVLRAERRPKVAPQASPLRAKRKDERSETSRARKARLVATVPAHSPRSLQARASLEDSCLTADGEDASFNSSDLAHFHEAFRVPAPSRVVRSRASAKRTEAVKSKPSLPALEVFDSPPSATSISSESSAHLPFELNRLSIQPPSDAQSTCRSYKFIPGHRSRSSGPSAMVQVQATIQEELSETSPDSDSGGSTPPGLTRSTSSSAMSEEYDFPSPIFLLSREPDIVAFDDEPESFEIIRGWRTWEREAHFEFGRSQSSWMDTDHSLEEIAHFTPPKKLSQVQDYIQDSTRAYKRLSASLLRYKRSSTLSDSRLLASPYYVDPEPAPKPKLKPRAGPKTRPMSIKTKFTGSTADIDGQPDSARLTSAKFAAFAPLPSSARLRSPALETALASFVMPTSPPPSLVSFAPLSPLKVPFLAELVVASSNVEPAAPVPKETLARKARRVSSNVRRERLGWGRRKASVDHSGEDVKTAVQPKRSSLQVQRDAPAVLVKARPASLDNKENVFTCFALTAQTRARPFRPSTALNRNPLRA